MKTRIYMVTAVLICSQMTSLSQPCLPEGITFSTQAEIDDYTLNYPGCNEIEGSVIIFDGYGNNLITDLTGLNVLTLIGGDLIIEANDSLNTLAGLESLASVGGSLEILHNHSLTELTALENLSFIGGDVWISYNSSMTSLRGLDNLAAGSINELKIYENPSLSTCEVESICHFLAYPGNEAQIYNNATGCNTLAEVVDACNEIYCLIAGIQFHSQTSINDFQINYPNCTEILGYVRINGNDINNLNGLSGITSIGGDLEIYGNPLLTNLAGLDALTYVGGTVSMGEWMPAGGNPSLESLEGLGNLDNVNDLRIMNNEALGSLAGLDNLNTINGNLYLNTNWNLVSLTGLENLDTIKGSMTIVRSLNSLMGLDQLTAIGGSLGFYGTGLSNLTGMPSLSAIGGSVVIGGIDLIGGGNGNLLDLTGLENITTIGGSFQLYMNTSLLSLSGISNLTNINGDLIIRYNSMLSSLSGMDNISAGSVNNLVITYNDSLSGCDVQSICTYLVSPGGTIEIHDNDTGCNSQQEVGDACAGVGIPEAGSQQHVLRAKPEGSAVGSYPNPFSDYTTFEYELLEPGEVNLTIFNHLGQEVAVLVNEVQTQGKYQVQWDAEGVPEGVYYYRLTVIPAYAGTGGNRQSAIPAFAGTGGKVMVVR